MKRLTCLTFFIFLLVLTGHAQGRKLWGGDANVGGTFTANVLAATTEVQAATLVLGASDIEINIPSTSAADDGKALIYSDTVGDVALRAVSLAGTSLADIADVTDAGKADGYLIRYNATSGIWEATTVSVSVPTLASIGNVTTDTKADGYVLAWDASGSVWSATPTSGGGSVASLDDIGDVSATSQSANDVLYWTGSQWSAKADAGATSLDGLSDVDTTGKSDNDVLTWNLATSKWEPETGGGGSGDSYHGPLYIVAAANSPDKDRAQYLCDGTADDVQIQAAIDAIEEATGGTVLLLEGDFYAASAISIVTDNIRVHGSGKESTTIHRGYNGSGAATDTGVLNCYDSSDGYSIEVAHLGINGAKASYTTTSNANLYVNKYLRSRFYDLYLYDSAGHNAEFTYSGGTDSSYNEINNVWSTGADDCGLFISSMRQCVISNCYVYSNGDDGMDVNGSATGSSIMGCFARDNSDDGFYLQSDRLSVSGCSSYTNGDLGFHMAGAENSTVVNCVSYDDTDDGFLAASASDSLLFSGCSAYSPGDDGFYSYICSDIQFIGCVVENAGGDGFFLYNGGETHIIGCTSKNSTDDGIEIDNIDESFISSNVIVGPGGQGINLDDCTQIDVSNNYVWMSDGGTDTAIQMGDEEYNSARNNYIVMDNVSAYAIDYDAPISGTNVGNVMTGNIVHGSNAGISNDGDAVRSWEFSTQGDIGAVLIASSSSTAKVGFATTTEINNVITVSSNATTNPIATSWDTYSDDRYKENITPLPETEKARLIASMRNVQSVTFDYSDTAEPVFTVDKYPTTARTAEGEIITVTDTKELPKNCAVVTDGLKKFERDYKAWWEWQQNPNRNDVLGIRVRDANLPDRFKSYNDRGEPIGLNTSQLMGYYHTVINSLIDRVEKLETRL